MARRAFLGTLTGGLLAAPLAAEAQPAGKVPRIGVLWPNPPATFDWVRQGLSDLGYAEGRNITFEYLPAREAHLLIAIAVPSNDREACPIDETRARACSTMPKRSDALAVGAPISRAVALAIRAGVDARVVRAEARATRVVVEFPAHIAWVALGASASARLRV
jgi:hypothetical protein